MIAAASTTRPATRSTHVDEQWLAALVEASLPLDGDDLTFGAEPELAARAAALGMFREIGTVNDQLSHCVFVADGSEHVAADAAEAELIEYRGHIGLRVRYRGHARVQVPLRSVRDLLHPSLSFAADCSVRELVILPRTVARIAALEEAELVIVPRWMQSFTLGGRDRQQPYHLMFGRPEGWSGFPHFLLHYCRLIEQQRIPFFITHDLIDHIAGFRRDSWPQLIASARRLRGAAEALLRDVPEPTIQTLVLPFMAGYLLDRLAQPRRKNVPRLAMMIERLSAAIDARIVRHRPDVAPYFPSRYGRLADLAFLDDDAGDPRLRDELERRLAELVDELDEGAPPLAR